MQDWLQANCSGFTEKNDWHPNSPDLNLLDCRVWVPCWKRRLMSWKTTWAELPQEHVNRAVANFTKPLTTSPGSAWLLMVVTLSICSNYLSSSLHPCLITNKLAHPQTIGEDRAWNAEKWECLVLKLHNFISSRHIIKNWTIMCRYKFCIIL